MHQEDWSNVSLYPSPGFISKNHLAQEGPNCVVPVIIPALAPTLDKSLKEDRTLCPVRALRYYCSLSWPKLVDEGSFKFSLHHFLRNPWDRTPDLLSLPFRGSQIIIKRRGWGGGGWGWGGWWCSSRGWDICPGVYNLWALWKGFGVQI